MEKQCSKCRERKTLDCFYKSNKGEKFGVRSFCKACYAESRKFHYEKNKGKIYKKTREWVENNRERANEYGRKSQEKRRNDPEKKEIINRQYRECYQRNIEQFRLKNKNRNLNIKLSSDGTVTKEAIIKMLYEQNGQCNYCKKDLVFGYETDHIIPISKNGPHTISNIQILCNHCNGAKGNKMPHEVTYLIKTT